MNMTTNYLGMTDIVSQMTLLNNKIDTLKNKLVIMKDICTVLSLYKGDINKAEQALMNMVYNNVISCSDNKIMFDKFGLYCVIDFSKQIPVLSITSIGDII